MFEGTLLDSSSARRPVLSPADWLTAFAIGMLGFFIGAMKLPVAATPDGTKILLLRAAIFGGALMFYSLSVCYAFKDARRQGFSAWIWAAAVLLANLPGFLIYLFYSATKTGDWKRTTLPMAYTIEALVVCFAALVPLINTQALPNSWNLTKPVLPPSRGYSRPQAQPTHVRPRPMEPNKITLPDFIPDKIAYNVHDAPPAPPDAGPFVVGVPAGPGAGTDVILTSIASAGNPPPPALKPKPAVTKRIVVGGQVEAAKAIHTPPPVYPHLAILARVQGTVKIHAIIGTDGTVQELTVESGNPLLVNAARDAVATWRYQPTLLNSEPVEVETEIDVNFVLND